jgi:hypothetical protein
MSLSKAILYKDVKHVERLIKQGAPLDVIDEYGYTPLVQAAIMDDVAKAEVLVEAGASIDFKDLTGRTPLHWAADNDNIEFCKLLLEHGANPNAYTVAGQSVLVMPLLRNQQEIKNLLYTYDADLSFAKDFIIAKLLGHRYELVGQVDVVNPKNTFIEIDFEGFYLEFTISILLNSLVNFKKNYGARKLRDYFSNLDQVIKRFAIASELIRYQHFNIDEKLYDAEINKLLAHEPLLIPVAYLGHAISFVRFGDLLAYCDRGEYGKKHGTVNVYKMNNPQALNNKLIKNLMYKKQNKFFIQEGIKQKLELELITQIPLEPQTSGNCSWANIEAAIPTLFFFLFLDENKIDDKDHLGECKQKAFNFYEQWLEWDKQNALHLFIEDFKTARKARKASKTATLAAILFQYCNYQKTEDMQKAKKILPMLTNPEFEYVIKSYVDVYIKKYKTPSGKKLTEILDDFGIDEEEL